MRRQETKEDRIIELIEDLKENVDNLSLTREQRDTLDYTFSELEDVLENGI